MADQHDQTVRRRVATAATVLALLPILLMVITRAGRAYLPTQDYAVLDLRVRDVWHGDLPLVGVYSRFGWNHPGPLLLWVLAPLNALFGGAPWTTLVGHALLQAAAVAIAAFLAWKRGGLSLVLGVLGVLMLTYVAIGDFLLFQPWNPHVAVVFFPAFVLAIWGVALSDRADVVFAAVLGTFLVQAHVGYLPLVLAMTAVAVGFVIADLRRAGWKDRTRWRTPGLIALGVTVVLWVPPLYEQLTDSPGNFRRMAVYFFHDDAPPAGLRNGLGFLAAEYRILPPWLGGDELKNVYTQVALPATIVWLVIPAALVALGLIVAARGKDHAAFRLVSILAVANVVGIVSLARVTGSAFPYLFYWRVPLAPLTVLAVGWACARHWRWSAIAAARAVGYGALGLLVVIPSVNFTRDIIDHPGLVTPTEATVAAMLPRLERASDAKTVVLRVADAGLLGLQGGLFDALDRAGVDVRTDTGGGFQFGSDREIDERNADLVWYVVEESALTSVLTGEPGAHVVAFTSPLNRADEAELTRLHRQLADELRAQGRTSDIIKLGNVLLPFAIDVTGLDPDAVDRVTKLNARAARIGGCRCAVVAFPADQIPDIGGFGTP